MAPEVPSATIAEFTAMVEQLFDQRERVEKKKAELSKEQETLTELESKILNTLEANKLDNFRTPRGLVSVTHRFSVKTPKTPEARQEFFNYLRERGLFEDMITVNSQTLNSFFRAEQEAALDRGDVDFKMPGIEEASMVKTLSMRKGK
jgi:hypothetical protein